MDHLEAERLFDEADDLFRARAYGEALARLDRLGDGHSNQHRILYAQARCLAELGRIQDARDICERLESEFQYKRVRNFAERLDSYLDAGATVTLEQYTAENDPEPFVLQETGLEKIPEVDEQDSDPFDGAGLDEEVLDIPDFEEEEPRFRIKPFRLIILVGIGTAVWLEWIPWQVGAGIVGAYFILKFLVGFVFLRLLMIPFKMKGAVLRGASAEVHSVRRSSPPKDVESHDEEVGPDAVWYEVDVTILPQEQNGAFNAWEPGELMVAPATLKIRKPDHLDKCHAIHACRYLLENQEREYEGEKYPGPLRLRFHVPTPPGLKAAKFAYYFETFGDFTLE